MVDENLLEKMHLSSKEMHPSQSEADEFNIPLKDLKNDFPAMVDGTPSALFCEFYQEIDLKDSKTIPLVLEIKEQYISDEIIIDKEKIILDYEPVARIGKSYALLGKKITPPKIL
jgi:flavin reductase (DIM6/NTAB) family NADH-FMN oxidoreductase RutF